MSALKSRGLTTTRPLLPSSSNQWNGGHRNNLKDTTPTGKTKRSRFAVLASFGIGVLVGGGVVVGYYFVTRTPDPLPLSLPDPVPETPAKVDWKTFAAIAACLIILL